MSRPKHRIKAPGAYFVTTETWQRRKLIIHERVISILLKALMDCRRKGVYQLHDFVIMPDHLHLILTPGKEVSLEKALQMIKGGSSHHIGTERPSRFPVWQAGFHEHWIRSAHDYQRCREYVEQNPVKAGLATEAEHYPYGSASGAFESDRYSETSGA